MVLVDTSVWVAHLRGGNSALSLLLDEGRVTCHPFIIGELACGNMKNREELFTLLRALPSVEVATHSEIMRFIEDHRLMNKGLGYVDVHLIASSILSNTPIWTLDKRLRAAAVIMRCNYSG